MVAMKVVLLLVILVTANMASGGESTRIKKYDALLENQLPRGPVPPSGPSPCHNKLDPFKESKFYYTPDPDYIICP